MLYYAYIKSISSFSDSFIFHLSILVLSTQVTSIPPSSSKKSSSTKDTPSVARSYMEGFTIHGLTKVFMGKLWEKVYWFLILMGVLGFVAFKIHGFHSRYQSNEFRTEIRVVNTDNYTLPEELQICSINIKHQIPRFCYFKTSNKDSPCQRDHMLIKQQIPNKAVQVINHTKDYNEPTSCVRMNSSKLDRADVYTAYKFWVHVDGLKTSKINKKKSGFEIKLGQLDKKVKPGVHKIRISDVTIINRLPSPFKSNCSNGEGGINVFPGPYTRQKCIDTLRVREVLKKCGSLPDHWRLYVKPHYEKDWSKRYGKNWTVNSVRICLYHWYDIYNIPLIKAKEDYRICPLPCREVIFESKVETESEYTQRQLNLNRTGIASHFSVQFRSKRMTEITEVPVYTIDNLFSDVGSWLGLLVGMSLLSIVEMVTFLSTAIVEKFC